MIGDVSCAGQQVGEPRGTDPITPVNDIRTAVCKAIGTTLARRRFTNHKGEIDFVIEHEGLEVIIKGATTAPNCEIVPIKKTVEITTFEMVCPDGEEPEELVYDNPAPAKEPVSHE